MACENCNHNCFNCGHLLYYDPSTKEIHHFTRSYHDHGYPYSDLICYHGKRSNWCLCNKPVCSNEQIKILKLSTREIINE